MQEGVRQEGLASRKPVPLRGLDSAKAVQNSDGEGGVCQFRLRQVCDRAARAGCMRTRYRSVAGGGSELVIWSALFGNAAGEARRAL